MAATFQSATQLAKNKQLRAASAELAQLDGARVFGHAQALQAVEGALARAERLLAQAREASPATSGQSPPTDSPAPGAYPWRTATALRLLEEARALVVDDLVINTAHAHCVAAFAKANELHEQGVEEAANGRWKEAEVLLAQALAWNGETEEIRAAHAEAKEAADAEHHATRHIRWMKHGGVAIAAALVLGTGSYFLFRDTFERDHAAHVIEGARKASGHAAAGQDFAALAAANDVLATVGTRELKSPFLLEAQEEAKAAKIKAEKHLGGLRAGLAEAKNLCGAKQWAQAWEQAKVLCAAFDKEGPEGAALRQQAEDCRVAAERGAADEWEDRTAKEWAGIAGRLSSVGGRQAAQAFAARVGETSSASMPPSEESVKRWRDEIARAVTAAVAKARVANAERLTDAFNQADLARRLGRDAEALAQAKKLAEEIQGIPAEELAVADRERLAKELTELQVKIQGEAAVNAVLEQAKTRLKLGELAMQDGKPGEALKMAERALEIARGLPDGTDGISDIKDKAKKIQDQAADAKQVEEQAARRKKLEVFVDFLAQAKIIGASYKQGVRGPHGEWTTALMRGFNRIELPKDADQELKSLLIKAEKVKAACVTINLHGDVQGDKRKEEALRDIMDLFTACHDYSGMEVPVLDDPKNLPEGWRPRPAPELNPERPSPAPPAPAPKAERRRCENCNGRGTSGTKPGPLAGTTQPIICPRCGGRGYVISK